MYISLTEYYRSLSGKIQLFVGGLCVVLMAGLGLIYYESLERSLMERNRTELVSTTELIHQMTGLYVESVAKSYLRSVAEKARAMVVHHYRAYRSGELDEPEARKRVRDMILDPVFGRIGETGYLAGVNTAGKLVIHPLSEGVNAIGHRFMQRAVEMKTGYLTYLWQNVGESEARLKVGYLSYFEPWDLILWASCYRDELHTLMEMDALSEALTSVTIGQGGYAFILDDNGRLLIHPRRQGQPIRDLADSAGRYYIRDILDSSAGFTRYPGETPEITDPNARLAYYKYLPETRWTVVSSIPLAPTRQYLSHVRLMLIGAVVSVWIIVYLVVSRVVSRMFRPVSRMKMVSDAIHRGDLTQRIEVTGTDEIGLISRQLNEMIESFVAILKRIKGTADVLVDSVQDLSVSAQEISSTANEQAAAVKEIVSTMEDSDALAKSIASRIKEVAAIANNTREAVSQGVAIIEQSIEKMTEIKASNAERIAGVRSLSERVDRIWDIVTIINGIADQTKIIAFNAELEAASAGDAGKNFKIVAAEIRRLADSTVKSTGEIKTKIDEIQHASDGLILSSEEGTDKILAGWELSSRLRKVFEDIESSSEISASSADHISLSIGQQASAFEQILLTLKQISEGIDNFVVSTRATTEASNRLKETAEDLDGLIDQYAVEPDGDDAGEPLADAPAGAAEPLEASDG
jgi:methyl-accepting chemotaxis protein